MNVFTTEKKVEQVFVETCSDITTIFVEGEVSFKFDKSDFKINSKQVPEIKENLY